MCKCVESNTSLCNIFFRNSICLFSISFYKTAALRSECVDVIQSNATAPVLITQKSSRQINCISNSLFDFYFIRRFICVFVGINYLFHMLFILIDMLIIVNNTRKQRKRKKIWKIINNSIEENKNILLFELKLHHQNKLFSQEQLTKNDKLAEIIV
jgi:hypothetical protein